MKAQLHILVQTVREALDDQAQDLAATIAFWTFFSIFPLLIGTLALTGYFLESAQLKTLLFEVLSNVFPGSAQLVGNNLEDVMRHRGTLSWISIGGLLWAAGKGFGAITRAVNRALGAKQTQFFLFSMVRQFLMAVGVSILMIVSIGITVAMEFVLSPSALTDLGLEGIEIRRLQAWILSFVLIFFIFALIYKVAPYVKVRWRQVLPGALLAAVLFEIAKTAFVLYLDRVAHFEAVYGPLASIIVLLLWLYVSALILVFGAEYNIVRWKARPAAAEGAPRDSTPEGNS